MPVSEAKLSANRQNSLRSTGPKTLEGKAVSRRNGLKHGLSGQGIVLPEEDLDEVELRNQALQAELAPRSALGQILVLQLATLSVKMERGAKHESAAIATRVRHAPEDFDAARVEAAEALFAKLPEAPRKVLAQLRKSPEGVDRLLEAWGQFRRNLTRDARPLFSIDDLKLAGSLLGLDPLEVAGTRLEALANANWGNFHALTESERSGFDEISAGKAWARAQLLERVDQAIAELEAHRATLDTSTIEQDRAEAPDRALFDPSREASLARRYESEARRGFFKALQEFREVETAEAEAETAAEIEPELGSSRESQGVTIREPQPSAIRDPRASKVEARGMTQTQDRTKSVARKVVGVG